MSNTLLHIKKHDRKPIEDDFWSCRAGRWKSESGSWKIKPEVAVTAFSQRDVYRSAHMPSHVSWAGIRMERDGKLKIAFAEITGKHLYPPTYGFHGGVDCGLDFCRKTIISADRGETWKEWNTEERVFGYSRPPLVLRDGSLLQLVSYADPARRRKCLVPVFKEDAWDAAFQFSYENVLGHQWMGCLRASRDGGRTWEDYPPFPMPPYLFATMKEISDGTIVAVGGRPRIVRDDPMAPEKPGPLDIFLSESGDKGRTWSEPMLMHRSPGKVSILCLCEEIEFVELKKGSFLFLVRAHPLAPNGAMAAGTNVVQFRGTRTRRGQWKFSDRVITDLPHSGFPQIIKTKDGALIYHNHSGIFFSLDEGRTWLKRLDVFTYYPSLLELPDGEILAACHTLAGDTYYPPSRDMAIKLMRFRHHRIGWLEQTDAGATLAVHRLAGPELRDFHLTVDLRHDGCEGVAFHLRGSQRYLAYLHTPRSPDRVRGNMADHKEQTFLCIARMEEGEARPLVTASLGKKEMLSWYQLQVSVKGNRIAVGVCGRKKGEIPTFIGAEMEAPGSGRVGLFTDLSTAAFTRLKIWPEAGNMRAYWDTTDFSAGETWNTLP